MALLDFLFPPKRKPPLPLALSGHPSVVYPRQDYISQEPTLPNQAAYTTPVIPADQSVVATATTFTFIGGPYNLITLIIDIPGGIACTIQVDGVPVADTSDLQGLSLALPYGDEELGVNTPVKRIQVQGVNNSTGPKNIRVWARAIA